MLREIPKSQVLKAIAEGGQVYSVTDTSDGYNRSRVDALNLTAAIKGIMDEEKGKETHFFLDLPEDKTLDLLPFPPKDEPEVIPPPDEENREKGRQPETGRHRENNGAS